MRSRAALKNATHWRIFVAATIAVLFFGTTATHAQSTGWTQLPNTQLQSVCPANTSQYAFSFYCKNVIAAWSGGIADIARNRLIIWGGGHVDYYGNEVYALNVSNQTLVRLNNPGPIADPNANASVLADGTPNSRHTYDGLAYIAHADRMFAFSGSLASNSGNGDALTWTLDLGTLQWKNMNPAGTGPRAAFGVVSEYDPNTRNVFVHDTFGFFQYNYDTNTYTKLSSFGIDYHDTAVIDPGRKLFITMGGDFHVVSIAPGSNYQGQDWSTQSTGCSGLYTSGSPGLAYDPVQKLIVGWAGGNTVYLLNPDTKSCTTMTFPNGPGAAQGNGTFGRFRYLPAMNAFAVVNDANQNAYILRLTNTGQTTAPTISGVSASLGSNGENINWTTDIPATSQVEYGATTSYGTLTTLDSSLVTTHSVALTGLAAGTIYHYRVRSKNSIGTETVSGDFTFTTVNNTLPPPGTTHIDFNYVDRTGLLNAGWSYMATTAGGGSRNTEQLSGALLVNYDQAAHPGLIRIPVGSGEIWSNSNNSQNMLVRSLPSNWSSIRLKIAAFNPNHRDQEVGLLAYQDDDNYVLLNRLFGFKGSVVELIREAAQATSYASQIPISNTGNLILRLDRNSNTYASSYSTDGGSTWISSGSTTMTLNNPKLAVQVGGNTDTTIPNADLVWVEIVGTGTITAPPPSISSVTPNTANQGQTLNVVIAGSNFQSGAKCSFGADITVNSCAFNSATQLTANITIAAAAATGARTVQVINPDNQAGSFTNVFTVAAPAPPPTPTMSGISPTSGMQGQTLSVTISGANFQSGAICNFGTGITVNSCTFNSASTITAGITIASSATAGARTVTVSWPNGPSITAGFTVQSAPAPPPNGTTHLDFNYADSNALATAGWSYTATTTGGGSRNTEQLSGALLVNYDQAAHPGLIRIPVGSGEIWSNSNNSQNMLVRSLPSNWSSIRLKIASFNPNHRDQEVGLLAYQDDDNYVLLNRLFGFKGSVVELIREAAQATSYASQIPISNTGNLILRLDRNSSTYASSYSTDGGSTWISSGSTTMTLNNPKLAVQVGGNTDTTIRNADLAWVEVVGPVAGPVISGVSVTAIGTNSATINWTTDVPATSQVEYGKTTSYGATTQLDSALLSSHSQTLNGLAAGTLYHFRVRSKDGNGTETISNDATFTTQGAVDTTPPVVNITAPANGSSASGTITVSASATDDVGVVGVQFLLDGANAGAEVTTAPYAISWNSTTVADGQHTMAARARDAAGNISTSAPVTVNVSNSNPAPVGSDFQSRCQASGVIRCWNFDDPAATDAHVFPPYGSTTKLGQVVNDVVADGTGALRFTIPSQSGADTSGSFWLNFADDLSKQFGEGQEFYVQYRVRYNDVMINTHFNNSNGFKMSILGEGDRPGSTAYSCTTLEFVLENSNQAGFPQAYHSCGTFQTLQVLIPNTSEFLDQNADGCPHYGNQGFLQTEPPCFKYKANEWITIQQHIKIGHWGQYDSTVEVWASDQGQPSRLIISLADFKLLNDNPSQAKYGKVWLIPYQTNKDSNQVTGTGYIWYDDLIVSTKRIADPDAAVPNAPDLLRAAPGSGSGTIQLTWRDNSGGSAQGFKIERCADVANSCMARSNLFTQINTVGTNVISWQDTGLASGQTYTYRVKAFNSAGDSASSGGACFSGGNPCYSQAKPN